MVTQYFTPHRHFGGYPFADGIHFRHRGIILYHLHGSIFTLLNDKWQWTARTTAETSANHITPVQALQLYQCLPSIKHTSNYQKKKHLSTRTLLHQIQPINNPCHTKAPPFAIAPTSQRLGQHSRANCTCSLLGVWLNHVALMQDHNSVVVYEHEFFVDSDYWRLRPSQKKCSVVFFTNDQEQHK